MTYYDCNACIHINITEEKQTDKRKDHICKFYNMRVIHRATTKVHNSRLYPCNKCVDDEFKNYKNNKNL